MACEYRRLQLTRFWHRLDIKLLVYTWMPLLHLLGALTSAVVAGIVGAYLHELLYSYRGAGGGNDESIVTVALTAFTTRLLFIEGVAALTIVCGLVCMVPSPRARNMWFLDALLALTWFIAFGFLMEYFPRVEGCARDGGSSCRSIGAIHHSTATKTKTTTATTMPAVQRIPDGGAGLSSQWRVLEIFSFLTGATLVLSALLSVWQFNGRIVSGDKQQQQEKQGILR